MSSGSYEPISMLKSLFSSGDIIDHVYSVLSKEKIQVLLMKWKKIDCMSNIFFDKPAIMFAYFSVLRSFVNLAYSCIIWIGILSVTVSPKLNIFLSPIGIAQARLCFLYHG